MATNWWQKNFPKSRYAGVGQSVMGDINRMAQGWNNQAIGWGWPGAQQGGGGNPYAGILADYLNTMRANYSAESKADAATRDAAIRRAVISYGDVPDFAKLGISDQTRGFLGKAINDKVRELAAQNTAEGTSVSARIKHANEVANRRIPANLAGRGLLHSGQTGSDLREQALNFKIQGFDTLNEMLSNIEGSVGGFLAAERARKMALAQAEMQAAMAAIGDWGGSVANQGGAGFIPPTVNTNPAGGSSGGNRRSGNRIMATRYIPGGRI